MIKVGLIFMLTVLVMNSGHIKNIDIDILKEYKIATPDGDTLELKSISYSEKKRLLKTYTSSVYKIINGLFPKNIYKINDFYLFEISLNGNCFVFFDEFSLNKAIAGNNYYSVSYHFSKDESQKLFPIFSLNPIIVASLLEGSKELKEYRSDENDSKAYLLRNNHIGYFLQRSKDLYQGEWMEDLETFKYVFKNIFSP